MFSLKDRLDEHGFSQEWESWSKLAGLAMKDYMKASPGDEIEIPNHETMLKYIRILLSCTAWHAQYVCPPYRPSGNGVGPQNLNKSDVVFYYCPSERQSVKMLNAHAEHMEKFFRKVLKATTVHIMLKQYGGLKLDRFIKYKRGEWMTEPGYCTFLTAVSEAEEAFDENPFQKSSLDSIVMCLWNEMQGTEPDNVFTFQRLDLSSMESHYQDPAFYEDFLVNICECHFVLPVLTGKRTVQGKEEEFREPGGKVLLPCNAHTLRHVMNNIEILHEHYHISISCNDANAPLFEMVRYRTPEEVWQRQNIHSNTEDASSLDIVPNRVVMNNPNFIDEKQQQIADGADVASDDEIQTYDNSSRRITSILPESHRIWKLLFDYWYEDMKHQNRDMNAILGVHGQSRETFIQNYSPVVFPESNKPTIEVAEVLRRLGKAVQKFRLHL